MFLSRFGKLGGFLSCILGGLKWPIDRFVHALSLAAPTLWKKDIASCIKNKAGKKQKKNKEKKTKDGGHLPNGVTITAGEGIRNGISGGLKINFANYSWTDAQT
jgi:hypothetical protein